MHKEALHRACIDVWPTRGYHTTHIINSSTANNQPNGVCTDNGTMATTYRIVEKTFPGENCRKLVENKIFVDCWLVQPNNVTLPNFAEKTFANSHKTSKLVKVFSLKGFPAIR